ncbi:MAG TPA: OmpA family protein [Puia sp.]|jgi:outer membrane protein OmpA-like peptidoglycan-associated protein
MRRIFFVSLLAMALTSYGQVKPSIIGFSANTVNFVGSGPQSGKYDPGFSLMYWKGINKKMDFSIRYNGLFSEYSKVPDGNSEYINEFEASLHARPINDDHLFSPFLSAGIGIGNYGNRWAAYTPLGGGLQLNMRGEGYIFLQANYRISLQSKNLDNNMFYSLGFTSPLGSPREKPVVKALPPPPVVEVKDQDKDGVPDSLDACPDIAGLPQFKGCPDTDGDGIPDKDDKCPNQRGLAKYNGCPIPDSDGDGINDEEDKCPDIAGEASNHGCPIVKEEIRKRADYAAQHIYFATASFILLKKSFIGLDEIAGLLKNDPALNLYVDGYTDNTGNPEKNQVLSENRAVAVKKYLIGKGIDENRIMSTGHGPADPVADNKTAAGRARNRRVVLKLDYQ